MGIALKIIAIFLISSSLVYLILKGYIYKKKLNKRIIEFLPLLQVDDAESKQKSTPFFKQFFMSVATVFKDVQFSGSTEKLLLEAGSERRPEEFLALRLLSSVGIGLITILFGLSWYICAISIIIGYFIPKYHLKRKRKKRLNLLSYQLIEVLGIMANSLRAGFSFMQAMQLVGKEVPDPLGPEFDRVVRQTGLGIPLEEIFEELVDRLPNKELEVVVRAILAQRKSGGNLAELLETMEETIRGRVRILEELNTLTSQGRLSAWIITLLPIGLGLYLAFVTGDYFQPMLDHPLGWTLLFVSIVSNIIGWLFIQKIIKIEV
ncbi:type II secretion system F family protein [Neobacillus sp. WH10]|uniref:type II secretion system F family protein n=1 Tax=Neobacillus sp. WH10 TaxID=3047873 RepID=UPI0024C13233|nr:type II secretion system F family protein [Neobacillus sp. WH10]WHY76777.1 type II secretion system F family protein [Neobacillus sp. WH10]